jgi:hypothetical protein
MTTYSKNLTNELKLSPFGHSDGEIRILTLGESGDPWSAIGKSCEYRNALIDAKQSQDGGCEPLEE